MSFVRLFRDIKDLRRLFLHVYQEMLPERLKSRSLEKSTVQKILWRMKIWPENIL